MSIFAFPLGSPFGSDALAVTAGVPPRDLYIDPVTKDLSFNGFDLALVGGQDSIVQDVSRSCQFYQGDDPSDTTVGLPINRIYTKNPNIPELTSLYRSTILGRLGVTSLTSFVVSFDRHNRVFNITFSGTAATGPLTGALAIPT